MEPLVHDYIDPAFVLKQLLNEVEYKNIILMKNNADRGECSA